MTLKKSLGSSAVWMSLAASMMSMVSFIVFIIISRILSPDEIGLVVFALLVVEAGKIIINGGLSISIMQRKDWDTEYASSSFYISVLYGLIVTGLVYFLGVPLTELFYDPAAGEILKVLSIVFMLEAIKVVHDGKLRRELRFNIIAKRSILASIVSSIIGVSLALTGYGVWALVAQQLCWQLIITIFTLICAHWWPTWRFSFKRAREAITIGTPMMLAQAINTLCSTLMEFMVGILLGPVGLGIFRVAGRALFILQEIIIRPLEQTSIPVLAKLSTPEKRADATLRIMRISSFIILPVFFITAAVAEEFIALVFGEKWHSSGEIMALIALGSAPFAIRLQINSALTSEGKFSWVLINMLCTLAITFIVGYLLIPQGLTYAALAFIIASYLSALVSLLLFYRLFRCKFIRIINALWPSYLAAGIMLSICLFAKHYLPDNSSYILSIVATTMLGAFSYILLGLLVFRKEVENIFYECKNLLPEKYAALLMRLQCWLKIN